MASFWKTLKREPSLVTGLIGALIALGVGFGLPLSSGQVGLIMAVVAALQAVATRTQVAPASDVQTALDMPARSTQADLQKEIAKTP